jgi:hypothetical protein
MNLKIVALVAMLLVGIVALSGCTDISDSYKPGSFGATEEEQQIVDAVTEKYGDMTASGEPRLLEVMMTSSTVNFIPVDKVLKYSKDSDELYAWFIYDNYNYDTISVEWIYLDTDYSIYTFESETGEDFGRGTFILEQPDDGWPLGNYRVIISGAGVEESIDFEIIDGATVSEPFDLLDGATVDSHKADFGNTENDDSSSGVTPGWYLVEVEDYDEVTNLHDYYTYDVDYERGNVWTSTVGDDGETMQVRTISDEPKEFYSAGEEIVINVRKEADTIAPGDLYLGDRSSISMDMGDVGVGGATSSHYYLTNEIYGTYIDMGRDDATGSFKEATFKANVPGENAFGGSFRILYQYGNGIFYSTNYIYEWRE